MNTLIPLETLVNFAKLNEKDVLKLGLYYGLDIQENGNINYDWLVSIQVPEGYLRITTPFLKDSCEGLIKKLQKKGYPILPIIKPTTLSNSNQLESLLLRLQQLTIVKGGYLLSISYWPYLPGSDHFWRGDISINSRWANNVFVQVQASSLYEVCTQLIEPFQQLDTI